jgi:hypothetical protein
MTIFYLFLWPLIGWSLEIDNTGIANSKTITSLERVKTTKGYSEKIATNILVKPESGLQEQKGKSVSVIKSIDLGPLLDSFYKKHRAYRSINRYEKITETSSDKNKGHLQAESPRDIEPTIRVIDKSLVLGGDGFGINKPEAIDYKIHFEFNSHIKAPPIYRVEKENISSLDLDFKKAQSKKFLIFHRSSSGFSRQTNIFKEYKFEELGKEKKVYPKIELIPSSWIFLDAHIKDFQNKETRLRLIPSTKPLDLIYDNPAVLQYDFQKLNSGVY